MAQTLTLNRPWLVAVWPGMGSVAITAGYYLMAKLGMRQVAEYTPGELFDVEHVEVKNGLIRTGRRPRSRFFVWCDPQGRRDLIVFFGEAQPPTGKYPFCHRLIDRAQRFGVERIVTFAAMATRMRPSDRCRVFGAATHPEVLQELRRLELVILEDGHISGLNGLLLGAAAERNLPGACLLGEMPHLFTQLPFPKASLAVLEAFATMMDIQLDLGELAEQARAMEQRLEQLMEQMEQAMAQRAAEAEGEDEEAEEHETLQPSEPEEPTLAPEDRRRIEELFRQAEQDRSKAYELKRELDRLNVFKQYEDRFLDLFKQ